jgi:hypothetical protein
MPEDISLKKYFLRFSILFFIFSLTKKCYCTTSQCSDSFMVLLLGWAGIFSGGAGIPWLANPLLFAAWIFLKKNLKLSMFLSVFATLFSLSFLLFDSIIDNEGGVPHKIISYRGGFWLWSASSFCMLVGSFILKLRENTRNLRQQEAVTVRR